MIRAALLCLCLAAPAVAQVMATDYDGLAAQVQGRIDFEDFRAPPEPGISVEGVIHRNGASIGETLKGLDVRHLAGPGNGRFDGFQGSNATLTPLPGPPGRNLAIAKHRGLGSAAMYPLGPVGFPDPAALGEGTFAVVFDVDQAAFGFRMHADYADPLGSRPAPGRAFLVVWDRQGRAVGFDIVSLRYGPMALAWARPDGVADIAGFTVAPDDPGGYAIDDIIFALPDLTG